MTEKASKLRAFIKKHFSLIVLIALLTIPTIYTTLFLGSMWDPYGNTGSLPVAVVNNDVSVVYDGKTLDVGCEMCDTLKKNDSLQFNFVDGDVADAGLKNGTYYMVIVIPEKFSYNATTLTSDNPTKMELDYYTNPGNNYIASKISNSAAEKIKASINESVINTYAEAVFKNIVTAGDGFQSAADGSGQIKDGLGTLSNGNSSLSDGLTTLATGCLTLKDGTTQLESGAVTLQNGIKDYTNGVSQVYDGTQELTSNNKSLNDGAKQLNDGLKEMSSTISTSLPESKQKDLQTLEEGLITLNNGIQKLNSSLNEGSSGGKISEVETTLNTVSNDLNTFVNSDFYKWLKQYNPSSNLSSYENAKAKLESLALWKYLPQSTKTAILNEIKTVFDDAEQSGYDPSVINDMNLEGLSTSLNTLSSSLNELTTGVKQLSDGGNQALPVASETLKSLSGGLLNVQDALDRTKEKDGKTGLIEGMTTLQSGIKTYTDGVSQVDSGVSQLVANSDKLNSGVSQLANGTVSLDNGATQLVDGTKQLTDGDGKIADGIDKLLVGATTLQTSLQDGADTVKNTNTGDDVTNMFASPVETTETQVTTINNNGEAMSAYMMCAALWVGCLAFCLMFSPYNSYLANRKGQKQFLRFSIISIVVAILQAGIMVSALMLINGLLPQHILSTFIVAILISLAFMSIVFFFNSLMGSVGSFVLLILLVLQLSGAAGTYPIELSPKLFQILHPLLPFSYGVTAFRSTLSTGTSLVTQIAVFLGIIVLFNSLTAVVFVVRSYRQRKKAQRKIDEQFDQEMAYYNELS